ncbi:MAG: chorismate synthase, partial [Acidobacteria bacterium]|nr:chorismate synthase [Acidobacteriota bacterium]
QTVEAALEQGFEPTTISTKGRHDPCLLPRFVPMAEAMVAIVLADHWLRWKASGRTSAGSQETGDRRQEAGDT